MLQRLSCKQFPNAFSILLIVLMGMNYFAPFSDLDFSWQIRTGELIIQTGQLRPPEAFSYTITGQQVPDFEWLYEVALWAVWTSLGIGGLKLLQTILVATPLILLVQRLRLEGVRQHGIALAFLTAVCVLSPAWNLRPLYCTTIGLLLVSGWLHDHCHGRRPLTWWLPLVMWLWCNLHPGVIVGQGLLVGAILWEWLNCWLKLNPPLQRTACWRLTLIGALGLATTLISPDPFERLLYPFRPELAHSVQRAFVEMRPLYTFLTRPPYTSCVAYLVAALVGLTLVLRFRRYRLWEVALLCGLAVLANVAIRSLQDWLLVMLALGVPHLTELVRHLRESVRAWKHGSAPALGLALSYRLLSMNASVRRTLNSRLFHFQWFWPVAAAVVLAALSLIPPLARRMPIPDSKEWPVAAVDWIEARGLHGKFFAPPDYGSYVGWRLRERSQCYVDTRGFFFPPELLEDSLGVPQLGPQWRARLQRILASGTDYFLLETTGARGQLWQTLRPLAGPPLYGDDQTVLLSAAQVRQALSTLPETQATFASVNPAPEPASVP